MNDFKRVDAQCEKIFSGIIELEKYIYSPIANEVLELTTNTEVTKKQDLLQRIRRSLVQYKTRGKDLVYIGLMGHFSTGKSSTINSILQLNNDSDGYREIGLNPVDTDITLITHKKNSNSVIRVTKEDLVSIRSSFIDSKLLENVVLADTPGSGDPKEIQEIAKNFLPICDLILYFFSATNPLDKADVPFLKEKRSQLEFVPMKFVITRADEFRIDDLSKLTLENFNEVKASGFKGELSQRLKQVLDTNFTADTDSILFVDNKSNYGISELREYILQFSDLSNSEAQIQIHSHKVEYFRSSVEEIQQFFYRFLLSKIANVSRIVERAKANIESFQNKVQVTNNELTDFWNRKLNEIQNMESDFYAEIPSFQYEYNQLSDLWSNDYDIRSFKLSIKSEAQDKAKLLRKALRIESLSEIESQFYRKRGDVNNKSLDTARLQSLLKIQNFYISSAVEDENDGKNYLPSEAVSNSANRNLKKISDSFIQDCKILDSCVETLHTQLCSQMPVKAYENILGDVIHSLSRDIDAFFESIKLYRTAVFSSQTKELIARLGLGQSLDNLEAQNLTEEEKEDNKKNAQEYIFPGRDKLFNESLAELIQIQRDVEKLQNEVKELINKQRVSTDINSSEWISEKLRDLDIELKREIEDDINNNLVPNINAAIQNKLHESILIWKHNIQKLREARTKRILYFVLGSAVLSGVGYFLYVYARNQNTPSELSSTVIIGLLINFASDLAAFYVGKLTYNFPQKAERKEQEIIGLLGQECQEIVKKNIESFKSLELDDSGFPELMQDFWIDLLLERPLNVWVRNNKDLFNSLKDASKKYLEFRVKYISIVNNITTSVSKYFSNPKTNLERLEKFTSNLKETSIEPSFTLLNETEEALKTLSAQIREVKF